MEGNAELSLEQTMLIGVCQAFAITPDLIAISSAVLSDTQIMDFLWWMEHRMNALGRYLRMEEVQSELSIRTFNQLPESNS